MSIVISFVGHEGPRALLLPVGRITLLTHIFTSRKKWIASARKTVLPSPKCVRKLPR